MQLGRRLRGGRRTAGTASSTGSSSVLSGRAGYHP
jgi:hypothetical protein